MKLIKMGAFLAALALAVIATSVAPALSANSWEDCTKGEDDDRVIRACTEVITEGRETSQELAQAYNKRCEAYYVGKKDYDRAIADCDKAIELDPKLADAYVNRCLANSLKGDYARELSDCNKAVELDPKFPAAYSARCWVRLVMGQVQQALADCSEALKLDPNNIQALSSRGFAYLKVGEYDQAIAAYDVGVKIYPKSAWMLYGRGLAKLKKGDSSGNEDIAAAKAIWPDIADEFARYGMT